LLQLWALEIHFLEERDMTSRKRVWAGSLLSVALCIAAPAFADTISYTAQLSGPGENPPNASPATGTASFLLTGDTLQIHVTFTGLTGGAASAAHIHCCAEPGTNAPVWVPFANFPNTTAGTYDATIDLATFAFGGGGTEAALIAGMNNGTAYTNIHNAVFPGGEIRGQITPTPEPGTFLLLGTGTVGLIVLLRRRVAPRSSL
jgi:hypothetical protein